VRSAPRARPRSARQPRATPGIFALLALLPICSAAGEPIVLEFGRYLAKYPAMYSTSAFSADPRDSIYDASGRSRDGVAPTYGADSAFPQKRFDLQFEWFFPFFETEAIPLISDRTWTARADLGYSHLSADGGIADYARSHGLKESQSGITDIALHFGPVLYGSDNWRERADVPLSILLLADFTIPIGRRHPDAAVNAGTNTFSYGATLGGYWRPIKGLFLDAGAHWRAFAKNDEPAFEGQEPSKQGSQLSFDATLAAKLWGPIYASGSYLDVRGEVNEYSGARASAHPPSAGLLMETFPDARNAKDDGIRDRRADAALHWFVLQRLRLSLHYVMPVGGRSGEFDLPYQQQLLDCVALPTGCTPTPNGSDHVDGLGPARVYASNYFLLSATWNFSQGDFWLYGP